MSKMHLQVDDEVDIPKETFLLVKSKGIKTNYTMFIHAGMDQLDTMIQKMPALASRFFFHLTGKLRPTQGNIVYIDSRALAEHFQRSLATIQNVMSMLVTNGYMKRIEKGKFQLNPHIVWSGSTVERVIACQEWKKE